MNFVQYLMVALETSLHSTEIPFSFSLWLWPFDVWQRSAYPACDDYQALAAFKTRTQYTTYRRSIRGRTWRQSSRV